MPVADIIPLVHLTIRPASFATVHALYRHIDELGLASEHRIRPSWDDYFSMYNFFAQLEGTKPLLVTLAELASLRLALHVLNLYPY